MASKAQAVADAGDVVLEPLGEPMARKAPPPPPQAGRASFTADALSALINLGYGQGDAAQAVSTVAADLPEADTQALIRGALKLLAPKAR